MCGLKKILMFIVYIGIVLGIIIGIALPFWLVGWFLFIGLLACMFSHIFFT